MPPQSTPVSSWFWILLEQVAITQASPTFYVFLVLVLDFVEAGGATQE
jgi:hypothetical protein